MSVQLFQSGECFGLLVTPDCCEPSDGSIGQGGAATTYRFQSEEGRHYFLALLEAQEKQRQAQRALDSLRERVLDCVRPSGRVRRQRLLDLIRVENWRK